MNPDWRKLLPQEIDQKGLPTGDSEARGLYFRKVEGHDDEVAKEYEEYLKEAPDSPLAPRVKDALAKLKSKKE